MAVVMSDPQVTDPVLDNLPTYTGIVPPDGNNASLAPFHAGIAPDVGVGLGISAADRTELRRVVLRAARVCLVHAVSSHYTEGAQRWSGITLRERSVDNHYPPYADCSSFFTWCHWDGSRWLKLGDYVNGADWLAGYTGTMIQHGRSVSSVSEMFAGDAVMYGTPGEVPFHTALYVGGGRVISDGSEAGPLLLPVDYRADVMSLRTFIY